MSLSEEFDNYIKALYPEGVSTTQYAECRKAFFGGCHQAFVEMMHCMSDQDDDVCASNLSKLHEQIEFEVKSMITDNAVRV